MLVIVNLWFELDQASTLDPRPSSALQAPALPGRVVTPVPFIYRTVIGNQAFKALHKSSSYIKITLKKHIVGSLNPQKI